MPDHDTRADSPPPPASPMGRLRGGFAPELVEEVMAGNLRESARHFAAYLRVHRAHTVMLVERGIVSSADGAAILRALNSIEAEGVPGLAADPAVEDLYFATERRLSALVGTDVGGRMHTGRSRNDLDATVTRLAVREGGLAALEAALVLAEAVYARAAQHLDTLMPGFTHLQHAQPVTLGHYLLAWLDMLLEDIERIEGALNRADRSPLGAAALAGTGFPIDRARTAALLGFNGLVEHTIVAVSSRAYAMELAAALAIFATTISRIANELLLWTTEEFAYAELSDAFAGTSSIMPQKKNPLVLETLRSRAATITTDLAALIEVFRGLPLGYNFDTYEAQALLWRVLERGRGMARLLAGMLRTVTFREERLRAVAGTGFSAATEVADVLVRETGLSFRQAHGVLATLVARLVAEGKDLDAVTPALLRDVSATVLGAPISLSGDALRAALDPAENVARRALPGGPARAEVERMLAARRITLDTVRSRVEGRRRRDEDAKELLARAIEAIDG